MEGSAKAAAKSAPADKSIAVLPFANMSPDPENAFFADGVHEDVITNLAKIRDLKVISRTSTLAYRDAAQRNLRKIADELGVAAVLEGSVRRAGNKVRVVAKLIDARTDQQMWGESYDRELSDIFAVQAALAQEIASALKANLTPGEKQQIAQRPTQNQSAYDLLLRARAIRHEQTIGRLGRDRIEQAIALVEQATALDSKFVLGYVQLAERHGYLFWFAHYDPSTERLAKMKAAVDAAVRIAPDSADTRSALGNYYYRGPLDFERALREIERAQTHRPNDAELILGIGLAHRRLGHWAEALTALEKAALLDPRDLQKTADHLGSLALLRRYTAYKQAVDRFTVLFPDSANAFSVYARSFAQFELDGDLQALRDRQGILAEAGGEGAKYMLAILAHDYSAADAVLAGSSSNNTFGNRYGGAFSEPPPLTRAYVAELRGDRAAARAQADAALAALRAGQWSRRQEPWAKPL